VYSIYSFVKTRRLPFLACLTFVLGQCVVLGATDTRFRTPTASVYEARIATVLQPAQRKLRLDIGASFDLFDVTVDSARPSLTVGADFMTFTRLRSEHNFKFPVETIDYWFGVNASYEPVDRFAIRLRAAHISSHLVDGSADTSATFTAQRPFVYSREFLELLGSLRVLPEVFVYAGGTLLMATQPSRSNCFIPQVGLDIELPLKKDKIFLHAGYDWRMIGISDRYVTIQAAQIGVYVDFDNHERGVLFSVYGFNGRSMHGMYFEQADSYVGFGVQFKI